MKPTVSLPDEDVDFLDEYAEAHRCRSRSVTVRAAGRLLRAAELGEAYAGAWEEWADSGDDEPWRTAAGDGFGFG